MKYWQLIFFSFLIFMFLSCASEEFVDNRSIHDALYSFNEGNLTFHGTMKSETGMLLISRLVVLERITEPKFIEYIRTDDSGNFVFNGLSDTLEAYYVLHTPYEYDKSSLYEPIRYEYSYDSIKNTTEITQNFIMKRKSAASISGNIYVIKNGLSKLITPYDGVLVIKLFNNDGKYYTGVLSSTYKDSSYKFTDIAYGNYIIKAYLDGRYKYESNIISLVENESKKLNIYIDTQE